METATERLVCCRPAADVVVSGELGPLAVHWLRDPIDDGGSIWVHLQHATLAGPHMLMGPFDQQQLALLATQALLEMLTTPAASTRHQGPMPL